MVHSSTKKGDPGMTKKIKGNKKIRIDLEKTPEKLLKRKSKSEVIREQLFDFV